MVAIATSAIRDRLVSILVSMSAVSGTEKTTMTRIRSAAQDYEGYIFRVRFRSSVNALFDLSTRLVTETWLIEFYSPKTGLGNEALKEDKMYAYRDSVLDTFQAEPDLQGLASVTSALITGDSVIWQVDESLDGHPRTKWTFNLEIERTEAC